MVPQRLPWAVNVSDSILHVLQQPHLRNPRAFDSRGTVVENTSDVFGAPPLGAIFSPVPTDEAAMLALNLDAHKITKDVRAKGHDNKSTKETYARHMRHYRSFWQTSSYAKGDPSCGITPISALPVTVAKAVVFVQYESTPSQKKRKRKGTDCDEDEEEASSIGPSGIKQAISALEDWQCHNHNQLPYKNIPEAQISLRTDPLA
ncbi:hypothetical protein B0H13DRAFT_2578168 [Mycena leptocephala]|nr:hypothetical protein B0H13DRAFT_2578168 [Mycena leptocephala]